MLPADCRARRARPSRVSRRWQNVLWYVLIVVSTAIFFWGAARLALKYRRGRTPVPLRQPGRARSRTTHRRRHARLDPAARPARRARAPARSSTASSSSSSGRRSSPSRTTSRGRCSASTSGGLVLPRLLALPRRVRRGADRRARRHGGEARASCGRSGSTTGGPTAPRASTTGAVRDRRLGVPRPPLLPGADRLPARGLPDRRRRPRASRCGRPSAGSSARASATSGSTASGRRPRTSSSGGCTASWRSSSSPRSRSRRRCTCRRARPTWRVQRRARGNRLLPLPAERKARGGRLRAHHRLSPKHLVDLDACTKCGKCHAACPATAPATRSRRATSSSTCASSRRARWGSGRRSHVEPLHEHESIRARRSDQARDALVVHAVHGVRRDLPGRDRARADHQPDAAAPGRAGRDGRRCSSGRWRRSTRPATRSARPKRKRGSLDARPRLRGQGRAQGAGRAALVRRRLRVVRPAQPAEHAGARADAAARRRRLRDPLRRRADGRQRRAARRRGGPLRRRSPRRTSRRSPAARFGAS